MQKKRRKKTKKELTTRLILYVVCAAAVCIGFVLFVFMKPAEKSAEVAESTVEQPVVATPAPQEPEIQTAAVSPKTALTDEEQIANCFANLDMLTGEPEFESLGGYMASEEQLDILRKLISEINSGGFSIGFILMDIPTGKGIAYNTQEEFYSASSVKGPYMVSLIAHKKDVLNEWGDIITEIAHTSDNGCYSQLYREFGPDYYNDWCDQAEASAYMYNNYQYTYYSPEGLARLWMQNYKFFTTDPDMGETAGELFENPEYSLIHKTLYPIYKTRSKSGWINLGEVSAIDSGIIYAGDHPYLLTILSTFGGDIEKFTPLAYELEKVHQDIVSEESVGFEENIREKLESEAAAAQTETAQTEQIPET